MQCRHGEILFEKELPAALRLVYELERMFTGTDAKADFRMLILHRDVVAPVFRPRIY